ncbi:MAG TPA: hypothetical protein VD932_02565 [Aquabacterium sp.]|nr:hypothetical protein [Aquabacterium sp.]
MTSLLAFLLLTAGAQDLKIQTLPTHNHALALAWADLQTQPKHRWSCLRYVWVPSGDPERLKAVSHAINAVSHAPDIYRPADLGDGKGLLVARLDLEKYVPEDKDLREWLSIWEEFQFDPDLSLLLTKGMLKIAVENGRELKGAGTVKRWKTFAGGRAKRLVRSREDIDIAVLDVDAVELIRLPAEDTDQELLRALQDATGSQAPVVTDAYFVARALAQIQDKGVYKEIFGGLYYRLAGIKKAKQGSDLDAFFESIGIGGNGVTAKQVFAKIPSNQRTAIEKSLVTGHPRSIEFLHSPFGQFGRSTGIVAVTSDLADQDIDVDVHPLDNLVEFKATGKELIYERANGLHGYLALNGDDNLVDEVPSTGATAIAEDHTITHKRPKRLQPAISCIACHEAEGPDGWQLVRNDVLRLKRQGVDPIGNRHRFDRATREKLLALYTGDPERALKRGRDDYSLAVFRCTGPWKASKTQTDVVKHSASKLVQMWRGYFFDDVDATTVLRECRVQCDPTQAKDVLAELLATDPKAAVEVDGEPVVVEDWRLGHLRGGGTLNRTNWALVQSSVRAMVQGRVAQRFKAAPAEKKP